MNMSQLCKVAVSVAIFCVSQLAAADDPRNASVITFQDLSTGFQPCPGCDPTLDLAGVGPTYSSQGYTFFYTPEPGEPFPVGLFVAGPSWPFNNGTNALYANSVNALTTLKRDDNRPFALVAMDLAETNGPNVFPTIVIFQGTTASGQLVSQQFTLDNVTGFQRFQFSGHFKNLTSVQWKQGDNFLNNIHMFDNVVVATEFRSHKD